MFFSVDKFSLSLTPFYFSKVHYFNKAKKEPALWNRFFSLLIFTLRTSSSRGTFTSF